MRGHVRAPDFPQSNDEKSRETDEGFARNLYVEIRSHYFLWRSLRTMYTIPTPPASRARLEGSGTGRVTFSAPAKVVVVAAQIMKNEIKKERTKRLVISVPALILPVQSR